MQIDTPEEFSIINDYDFVFETGMMISFSLYLDLGDTIDFQDHAVQVRLVPKPSPSDPDKLMPGEDTTIFLRSVAQIQHRVRQVKVLTPEQKAGWKVWQASGPMGTTLQ